MAKGKSTHAGAGAGPQARVGAGPLRTFTKRLGEYKELIAILVFFAGGAAWVFGYFATKREVEEFKCRQSYDIQRVESDVKKKSTHDAQVDVSQKLLELERREKAGPPLTEQEKRDKSILKVTADALARDYESAEKQYDEAVQILKQHHCLQR